MELLSRIFYDYYQAKIIEVLLENHNEEFSIREIMRMADTAQGSTYNYMKFLIKEGLINKTRKIGNVQLYKLNKDNDYIKAFLLFENYLVTIKLDKLIMETEIKTKIRTIEDNNYKEIFEYFPNEKFNNVKTSEDKFKNVIAKTNIGYEETEKWKRMTKK